MSADICTASFKSLWFVEAIMRLLKLQLKDGTWSGKVCKMVMRSMSKTKKSGLEEEA